MASAQIVFCRNCGVGFQTTFEDEGVCGPKCSEDLSNKKEAAKSGVKAKATTSFYVRIGEMDPNPQLDVLVKKLDMDPGLHIDRYLIGCRCDKCRKLFKGYAEAGYPLPIITLNSGEGQQVYMKFGIEEAVRALGVLQTTSVYAPTRKAKRIEKAVECE